MKLYGIFFLLSVDAKDFRLPQIQKPLVAQAVPKNNTAVLKVVLTADPIPEVEW